MTDDKKETRTKKERKKQKCLIKGKRECSGMWKQNCSKWLFSHSKYLKMRSEKNEQESLKENFQITIPLS